jgi:predicted RNase H-related nuclease YkuK (DUF458 family)
MDKYQILNSRKEVDLISHIEKYLEENPNTEILVGCDSQNHGRDTVYAIVVGLYKPGKGAHVLFRKFKEPRGKAFTQQNRDFSADSARLLNEVWLSVSLAEDLKAAGLPKVKYIDIDINPDPKYKSNSVLASGLGLVKGMGYDVRHKGQFPMLTYCADSICK